MSLRRACLDRIGSREAPGVYGPSPLVNMPDLTPQEMLDACGDELELARHYECSASHRYYQTRVVRDLFGAWCVIALWGGMGSRRGQLRTYPQADRAACLTALDAVEKRRLQRGYVRVAALV